MNGILLLLPVFLPLVLGLLSYFLPIRSESCRRLVYSLLILGTTALAWAAILLCDDGAFTLLHFSHRLTIAFRMDGAARLFAGLSATLWPFTMLYGFDYMRHEKHLHMFWAFFTASFGVTLGIAFSANMMTMYLFYELLTLATLPLVMQPMTKAAKKAGIKYLVYSISGAALAFIGLVFLAIHDAVDFTLGGHLAGYDGDLSMLLAVFALSFVGFGVKAAIWPLHGWLPSAAVAPTPVTALLHAVAVVKAGAFACIRLIYYSFGTEVLAGTWAQQLALLLPMGIGTAVGTLLVNFVLKKFSTKKTFILFCVYGASSMAILFLVSKGIGFNSTLIVPFLILNFFCGLQHGNTNVTPNIMIADCVDEIEWKTGQRKDGLAYAGYGLFSKIASAFTKALGPWLLYTWSGYAVSRDANVAYAAQTDSTLNKILMIYTIIPAVFVVLQAVPIFFYDMVGEKKARITRELMERREAAGLVAGEGEETADAAAAE